MTTNDEREALQGLWKLDSIRSQGQPVGSSVTHWEFDGDRLKEIVPQYVDGGTWATFTLDTTTTPKHLDTTYTDTDEKTGEITTRTYKQAYELDGDTLRVGNAVVYGHYPEAIDEAVSSVTTLSRYTGPRPETKQASGRASVDDPTLGTVTWNDNFDQWEATFTLGPDQDVSLTMSEGDTEDEEANPAITAGAALAVWVRKHESEVRAYAAQELLALAEDWRDEDEEPEPITLESFADRIMLQTLASEADGSASFWYDDDAIFAGHVIVVAMEADHTFTDAQIMG